MIFTLVSAGGPWSIPRDRRLASRDSMASRQRGEGVQALLQGGTGRGGGNTGPRGGGYIEGVHKGGRESGPYSRRGALRPWVRDSIVGQERHSVLCDRARDCWHQWDRDVVAR